MANGQICVRERDTKYAVRALLVSCEFADTQFLVSVFYGLRDSINNHWYNTVRAPDSKMSTEVAGTLTHADTPQRDNVLHSAPHPACVYQASINTHMKLLFVVLQVAYRSQFR
jgi:hypothetical protein